MRLNNIIVLWADLGAAKNFVKNTLLLDPMVDIPIMAELSTVANRLKWLQDNIYTPGLDIGNWLDHEYLLRTYQFFYGFDFTITPYTGQDFDLILNDRAKQLLENNKKIVFAVHDIESVQHLIKKGVQVTMIAPQTQLGIQWQIRAYCEKLGAEKMHNFTFAESVEQQKQQYIQQHGQDEWVRLNLTNMRHMLTDRSKEWQQWAQEKNIPILALEQVLTPTPDWLDQLNKKFDINVQYKEFDSLYKSWIGLHWPMDQTLNWKHGYIFDEQ
jgi:hypothetical protein